MTSNLAVGIAGMRAEKLPRPSRWTTDRGAKDQSQRATFRIRHSTNERVALLSNALADDQRLCSQIGSRQLQFISTERQLQFGIGARCLNRQFNGQFANRTG